jgi:hypothetical protein
MTMDLPGKVAAFCRELGNTTLAGLARQEKDLEPVYRRVEESLRAGRTGRELEDDLDTLDAMVLRALGQGLYPSGTRGYAPLPEGARASSGARWWTCPRGWCAGRGRVRPGQAAPSCAVAGESLVAGPLPG